MLYLAMMDIMKKWTGHRQDCKDPFAAGDFLLKKDYPVYKAASCLRGLALASSA